MESETNRLSPDATAETRCVGSAGIVSDSSDQGIVLSDVTNQSPNGSGKEIALCEIANQSSDGSNGSALSANTDSKPFGLYVQTQSKSSQNAAVSQNGTSACSTADCIYIQNQSEPSGGSSSSGSSNLYSAEYPPRCDHFVDAETLKYPDRKNLSSVRVLHSLIRHDEGLSRKPTAELLDLLRKTRDDKSREPIRQTLLTRSLPKLADLKKLSDLSQFLTVSDSSVQPATTVVLEELLLQLPHSEDSSITEELLKVVANTQKAFLHTSDDDNQVHVFCYLHLMAASALLSRCPRPSADACASFMLLPQQHKKQKQAYDSTQQTMLKALYQFFENFQDELGKSSSFPVWTNTETGKRKERIQRANCCELIVFAYTFFNEVAQKGWSHSTVALLETLRCLYKTSRRVGKNQFSSEVRTVFDFVLVRSLVTLLNTSFKEGMPQVGEQERNHEREMADLIVDVINGASADDRESLMNEVKALPFHSAMYIRQIFNLLLRTADQRLGDLTLSLLETKLRIAQFQRELFTPAEGLGDDKEEHSQDDCSWHTVSCKLGQKPAEAVIYVPKASCMADSQLDKCISDHPWIKEQCPKRRQEIAERSERHRRNMDFLKKLSPHSQHLLRLWAYQFKPFPFFVTEPVENRRLLGYLLKHRREQRWLDTSTLVHVTSQILRGLTFLADRGIVTRDITAYNMVVETDDTDSNSGFLTSKCTIKLADLGLAHEYRSNDEIRPVRDQGPVPVRWTPHEALFEGRYTDKSMVYSLGCVMYELWTHGCQPFTSYDTSKTTEDILIQMFGQPESTTLYHWPCIPDDVFDLIQRCTHPDPDKRPTLQDLEKELQNIKQEMELEDLGLEEALRLENQYPVPSPRQEKRNHKPETGIPASVQELMNAGKQSPLYTNTRKTNWKPLRGVAVTDQELCTLDWLDVDNKDDRTIVKEVVTAEFTHEVLPSVEANNLPGVTWVSCDQGTANRAAQWQDGLRVHKREYPPSLDLHTAARKGLLSEHLLYEDGTDEEYEAMEMQEDPKYLVVFLSLAEAVARLHEQGFCHRDLRAKNILIDVQNGQAILARIGRMCRIPSVRDGGHRFVIGDVFQNSYRWLAPETLISGQYGPENDVFMVGTLIWETFWIRDVTVRDPAATDRSYAPCTDILKNQVLDFVRENTPLPHVAGMPDWLYELVLQCRNPELGLRPTILSVVKILKEHVTSRHVPEPFFAENSTTEERKMLDEPTPVVLRRQSRHFRNTRRTSFWSRFTGRRRITKRKILSKDDIYVPHLAGEETERKMVTEAAQGQDNQANRVENPYSDYQSNHKTQCQKRTKKENASPMHGTDSAIRRKPSFPAPRSPDGGCDGQKRRPGSCVAPEDHEQHQNQTRAKTPQSLRNPRSSDAAIVCSLQSLRPRTTLSGSGIDRSVEPLRRLPVVLPSLRESPSTSTCSAHGFGGTLATIREDSSQLSEMGSRDLSMFDRPPDHAEEHEQFPSTAEEDIEESYRDCQSFPCADYNVPSPAHDSGSDSDDNPHFSTAGGGDSRKQQGGGELDQAKDEDSHHIPMNDEGYHHSDESSSGIESEDGYEHVGYHILDDQYDENVYSRLGKPSDNPDIYSRASRSQVRCPRSNNTYSLIRGTFDDRREGMGLTVLAELHWNCIQPSHSVSVENPLFQSDSSCCLQTEESEVYV